MSRRDLGYLIGIIFGDGNLSINNGGYRIRIFLHEKETAIANKIKLFGKERS